MSINHSGGALHRLSRLESYLNMKSTGDYFFFFAIVKLKFPRSWVNEFHPAITIFWLLSYIGNVVWPDPHNSSGTRIKYLLKYFISPIFHLLLKKE